MLTIEETRQLNIEWLLRSDEPWTCYRAYKDLLHMPNDDPDVVRARQAMLTHPQIQSLIETAVTQPPQCIAPGKGGHLPTRNGRRLGLPY